MKNFRLAHILGLIDDDLVTESAGTRKRYLRRILRWSSMAAAACLCVVIIGAIALSSVRMGSSGSGAPSGNAAPEAAPAEPGEVSGDAGEGAAEVPDNSSTFMSYKGPILPLSLVGDSDGVIAEREITMDFSPYVMHQEVFEDDPTDIYETYNRECLITDNYVLTNNTDSDINFTALCPFIGSFQDMMEKGQEIYADGERVKTWVYPGATFHDMLYDIESGANSWQGYKAMLGSGDYKAQAMADWEPVELTEKVIVYELYCGDIPEEYTAADVSIGFSIDDEKTEIMYYDITGYSRPDVTKGWRLYSSSDNNYLRIKRNPMIIVRGEDIGEYTVAVNRNGIHAKDGKTLDIECGATRRETTLGEVLLECVMMYAEGCEYNPFGDTETLVRFLNASASRAFADGYSGDLELPISNAFGGSRVIYEAFELSIPAGESVSVRVELTKGPSCNFGHSYDDVDLDINGYDMATVLDSNLEFSSQTATLEDRDIIEIVNQNFGFDIENGIKTVELDMNIEHYYLEIVRKKPTSD